MASNVNYAGFQRAVCEALAFQGFDAHADYDVAWHQLRFRADRDGQTFIMDIYPDKCAMIEMAREWLGHLRLHEPPNWGLA